MKKAKFENKMFCLPDREAEPAEYRAGEETPVTEDQSESNFSGELQIRIPKSLHSKLHELAEQEGVSLEQYILYKLTQ